MIDKAQTVIQNHAIEIPDDSDDCKDYEKESKKLPAKFSKMGPFVYFLKNRGETDCHNESLASAQICFGLFN